MNSADTLQEFLRQSHYCDFTNPQIIKLARELRGTLQDQREIAVKLFYWVRDNILYQVGDWNKTASQTFIQRSGTCTNKANLLVALLRASGIPAGYRVLRVKGQEYFGPVALPTLKHHVGERSIHAHAYVYLDGGWIKCDPSDDIDLALRTQHFNPQSKIVEWDGQSDAELNLDPDHIIEDLGLLANIDHIIGKQPHRSKRNIIRIGNLYIKFLRNYEHAIKDVHVLEKHFIIWLRRNYFWHYILFYLARLRHRISSRSK